MTVYDKNDINHHLDLWHPGMCVCKTTSSWLLYFTQIAKAPNSRDVSVARIWKGPSHSTPCQGPGDTRLLQALG